MNNSDQEFIEDIKISEDNENHIPLKFRDESYKNSFKEFLEREADELASSYGIPKDIYVSSKIDGYEKILKKLLEEGLDEEETAEEYNIENDHYYLSIKNDLTVFIKNKNIDSCMNLFYCFLEEPKNFIDYLKKILLDFSENNTIENMKISIGKIDSHIIDIQNEIISKIKESSLVSQKDIGRFRKFQFNYISSIAK